MELSHVMNCNKIKQLKVKEDDVVEAVKDSDEVEVSADNKKIRRKEGKAVPALEKTAEKKREAKAAGKEEEKAAKEKQEEEEGP